VTITVNGRSREFATGMTVAAVVAALTSAPAGVAVALNDAVVSREAWDSTTLDDGDRMEVIGAVQGG
jgi:sulfur carrier protein